MFSAVQSVDLHSFRFDHLNRQIQVCIVRRAVQAMDASTMDKVLINWEALDALVLDYAEAEQLLMDNEKNQNSFVIRCTIGYIRGLIEQGSITEALELLQLQAPSVLQDQRLVFRLHKQKFIELLRSGGLNAHEEAIKCCRTILGPCALTAYPEAYQEFKQLLLALIYDKDDAGSPVIEEWSEAKRIELAATITSVLKAQLRAYDPLLSLTLRYLLSLHNSYCCRQGIASPIAELTNDLLDKEKDPPATPHDCLLEAPKFEESDVQALANAVDLSRQGAVDSLRYTGGDLILAFKNELSRIRINTRLLDDLIQAYCVYRGLIDGSTVSVSSTSSQNVNTVPEAHEEQGSCAKSESEDASKASTIDEVSVEHKYCDGAASQHQSGTSREDKQVMMDGEDVAMEDQADTLSEHSMVCESAHADSGTASGSICSTSDCGALEQKQHAIWRKYKSNCPRKRWSGRPMHSSGSNRKRLHCEEHVTGAQAEEGSEANKFSLVLEIKEMACDGMVYEVIQKVNRLNPHFFEYNPHLLFQLKQMEFLKLVEAGNYTDAVAVARCDLGPLAAKHTDLLKALKETVLALARPQGEQLMKSVSPSMLGATLQVVLSASLGVAEPDLMRMIKVTLQTHSEWFKLQMCSDPFGEMLKINALRDMETGGLVSLCHNSVPEASTVTSKLGLSSQSNSGNPSQQSESSREGAIFDDRSILTVMEWLALPRGDAIQLLAQYGGSVESIFEHELA